MNEQSSPSKSRQTKSMASQSFKEDYYKPSLAGDDLMDTLIDEDKFNPKVDVPQRFKNDQMLSSEEIILKRDCTFVPKILKESEVLSLKVRQNKDVIKSKQIAEHKIRVL